MLNRLLLVLLAASSTVVASAAGVVPNVLFAEAHANSHVENYLNGTGEYNASSTGGNTTWVDRMVDSVTMYHLEMLLGLIYGRHVVVWQYFDPSTGGWIVEIM